ncbi:MAG: hypothetical protein HY904_11860 [Deltaproteobacteria bacterium]|nr:hypothetical protein [Deltaproteobacteria bacterium]
MGLLDFLKTDDKKKIAGLVKKVKEPYSQPEVRQEALEALFKMATPEAYAAALKRFTYVCQSLHWDGEEKKWLVENLVKVGMAAVPPLQEFVRTDDNVNLAFRALERIVPEGQSLEILLGALTSRSPEDYRRTQAKLELIDHLGTRKPSPEVWAAVAPYLDDHSDDVRTKLLEVVEGWNLEAAGPAVAKLIADDTLSARVHRRAAQCLCALKVKLNPPPTLPPAAAEDYTVDGDGQVVRKKPA